MIEAIAPQERYLAAFQERTGGEGPAWLPPLRRAAISRFAELGFPTRHDEEWRFTHLGPMIETTFEPADTALTPVAEAIADLLFDGATHLVFVNGRYAPDLSTQ